MATPSDPLAPLLARYFAAGDAGAMEEVVRRTRRRLLRVAGRACTPQDAEDAVQAAYHALLRRGRLPDGVPPTGWLVTTVVRMAWRLRARALSFETVARRLSLLGDGPGPAEHAQRSEEAARVRAAIARLPAAYRDPLVLHHLQGVPVAELARLMGLPANTIKTRLRRGRRLLEGRLSPPVAWTLALAGGLGDLLRPNALSTGGIMKAKTAIGIGIIALASGSAGFALGGNDPRPRSRAPKLALERVPATAAVRDTTPQIPSAAPAEEEVPASDSRDAEATAAFEHRIAEHAGRLGASEAAVRRARYALQTLNGLATARRSGNALEDHHLAEVQQAVDKLRAMGEDGFLGVLALAHCCYSRVMGELLARVCPPGGEAHLVCDAADESVGDLARVACLEAMARLDAPEIDAALPDIVGRSDNLMVFVAAVEASSARSVALDLARVEKRIRDPGYASRRVRLLRAVGRSGGDKAVGLLMRLARDAAFDQPGPALAALATLDPDRAAAEAAALLDGPRKLHPMQAARLRVVAGRW